LNTISWNKILCPVDFSAESRAGLEVAADIARRFEAPLVLLHVAEAMDPHAVEALAHLREEAVARGVPEIRTTVAEGSPKSAIARYADEHGFDLVVMGTHGWTGRAHALAGSVAESTVRSARCPVMVVHGERAEAREHAA
jgi:universal stress protein A